MPVAAIIFKINGQNGFNSRPGHNDAVGGAGGGRSIKILAQGSISGITINANGGNGGNQLITDAESEGPGGGGGYIESVPTSVIKTLKGGLNGTTSSSSVTEFMPNGATQGSPGTYASAVFTNIEAGCSLLPITLLDFSAVKNNGTVSIHWQTSSEINCSGFYIERSADGKNWNTLLFTPSKNITGITDIASMIKRPVVIKAFIG